MSDLVIIQGLTRSDMMSDRKNVIGWNMANVIELASIQHTNPCALVFTNKSHRLHDFENNLIN
jgi:hypothetical protein